MNEIIHQYKKTISQFLFIFGIGIILLVLALILFTARKTAFVGSGAEERATITVSGTGKLDKVPDTARISFTISDTQKSLATAQKNVSATVASITDALAKAGIRQEKITTQNYTSYPKYEYPQVRCFATEGCPQPGAPVLVGYTLSHSVTISVEDLEKVEQVLGIIGGFTVENISGPSFGFSDEEKIQQEVRALAIENAEKQARVLARDLGVRLVRVVSYSEQSDGMMYDSRKAYSLSSAMPESAPTIPVGEQNLEKTVSVTYEIR